VGGTKVAVADFERNLARPRSCQLRLTMENGAAPLRLQEMDPNVFV
jgi:hypothetical protein